LNTNDGTGQSPSYSEKEKKQSDTDVKFVCGSWEKNVLTFLIINDWVGVGFMVWRAQSYVRSRQERGLNEQ